MVQALMEEIDKFDSEQATNTAAVAAPETVGGFAVHRLPVLKSP